MATIEARQIYEIECPARECSDPADVVRAGKPDGKQRYRCKTCGHHFFADGKAHRKWFPAQQIAAAIDKYYSGMSYKQVAEFIEDYCDAPEPSKATVHAWVKAYTVLAHRFLRGEVGPDGTPATATGQRIRADVGDHWVADEMVLRVGGRKFWNWNVMDRKTRYVLATRLSPRRTTHEATALFEDALANAQRPPKRITTDGLGSYVDAIRAVFPKDTVHEVSDGIYEPVNNNMSERLQKTFRSRTKSMDGLHARLTGQAYLDGWTIDYNFFKDHRSLDGRTPAEAAGVKQQVPWESWEDVTRIGGEVAELRVKETTPVRKQPGPKPGMVRDAVAEFIKQKQGKEAKAKKRSRPTPVVAPFPKRLGRVAHGGRGKKGMKL